MSRDNNDNVSRSFKNNNVNDIDRKRYEESDRVERVAQKLVETFGSPGSWAMYCLIAGKLPENIIWQHVETVKRPNSKVRSPGGLFNTLCKKSIYKLSLKGD